MKKLNRDSFISLVRCSPEQRIKAKRKGDKLFTTTPWDLFRDIDGDEDAEGFAQAFEKYEIYA